MKLRYGIWVAAMLAAAAVFFVFKNRNTSYDIETVTYRDIGYTVSATGKVEGWKEADISAKSPGRIEFIVEEGKNVKTGDVLVSLDKGELTARLEDALHTMRQAEIDMKRYRELYEKGYASRHDFDHADTAFKKAVANVKIMQELLKNTVLRAPFDCVVVKRYKELGETVGIATVHEPILKIADIRRLKVRAEIEESDIGKIKTGLSAEITCDAYKGEVFEGKVLNVGYAAGKKKLKPEDPKEPVDTKVVESEIEIQPTEKLKIGMIVDIKIKSPLKTNVLSIQKRTVITEKGESYVRSADGKDIKIRTGLSDDAYTEILDGLKEGDRVIIISTR